LPRGGDVTLQAFGVLINRPTTPPLEISKTQQTILPLPRGEAGERASLKRTIVAAEQRQKLAHGISRGNVSENPLAPEGRKPPTLPTPNLSPLRGLFQKPQTHSSRRGLTSAAPPVLNAMASSTHR